MAEAAAELAELAVENERQNIAHHERVRDLANKAMGGSFTAILKACPLFDEDERSFLKEHGYI